MEIYVVRHGESTANVSKIHQTPDEPLTEMGQKQAQSVALRFSSIPVDKIISSPYTRTLDTAKYIQAVTHTPLEINDLLVEIKRPTELTGLTLDSVGAKQVFREMIRHEDDRNWHYSNEENFYDLKSRVEKAREFLEKQTESRIAIVTHSVFIRMLLGILTFKENMSPVILRNLGKHFKINNTGLTLLRFEDDQWDLLTWNDHSHLG